MMLTKLIESSEVNCEPRSEERSEGIPKRATHVPMNVRATSEADVEERGTASGQRVVLSTMVKR